MAKLLFGFVILNLFSRSKEGFLECLEPEGGFLQILDSYICIFETRFDLVLVTFHPIFKAKDFKVTVS